jgi:hypothetical protein
MPGASVKVGPVRVGSGCCVAFVVPALVAVVVFFALGGTAIAKQYVLKNPKQKCKAHYVKKTKTIKKHEHGRTVKVHEIVCVYVAPKQVPVESPTPVGMPPVASTPSAPAPTPTKEPVKEEIKKEEPKQIATVTKLEASNPEECSQSFVLGGETETCYFEIFISVHSAEGEALSSPTPTFTFTNEGEPGKTWSFNSRGLSTFYLAVTNEFNSGLKIEETYLSQSHELLAKSHGLKPWKVYASYSGTNKYAASQSTTLSLALH